MYDEKDAKDGAALSSHDSQSLEKGGVINAAVADERYRWDVHDIDRVQRRLKQRHVQM